MLKYKVIANYTSGHKVNYIYEGDSEYLGKFESVLERIQRHFTKKSIQSYEIIPVI